MFLMWYSALMISRSVADSSVATSWPGVWISSTRVLTRYFFGTMTAKTMPPASTNKAGMTICQTLRLKTRRKSWIWPISDDAIA
jgi:hypothetical protein